MVLSFGQKAFNHAAVTMKSPGRRKLSQTMTDHGFIYIDFFKNFAVVDHKGVADKIRMDLASAGPSFDRILAAGAFLF